MVAVTIFVAFVSLFRGKGLLCIPDNGVKWIRGYDEIHDPARIPVSHTGAPLLVAQRKTRLTQHSFATIKAD